ncbi:MAG: TraR/DksA C4-type zinc finger protein [Planctomycetota bacterium]|nr:TraR/DksA C4-type zinc finger protein [Planctomycetota bacterium]
MAKVKKKVLAKRPKAGRAGTAGARKPAVAPKSKPRVTPHTMKKTSLVRKKTKVLKSAARAAEPPRPKVSTKAAKAAPRKPLTPELRHIKARLQAMLNQRRRDIDQEVRGASARDLAHIHDTSDMASDAADGDLALRIAESETVEASEIERAMEKVDNGTYGMCEMCNKPIGAERMQFLPYVTLCIKCQGLAEIRKREQSEELDDLSTEGGEPDAENN